MGETPNRVRMEEIDWPSVFPWLCLLRSFRMAMQPAKLTLALAMVALAYLGGLSLDAISESKVHRSEITVYARSDARAFEQWRQARADEPAVGVFEEAMQFKLTTLDRMARAAVELDLGIAALWAPDRQVNTVGGALRDLVVALPCWFAQHHPGLLAVYMAWGLILWSLFGGAIARLAALDAAGEEHVGITSAIGYSRSRFVWFILTPLLPVVLIVGLALALVLGGFVFFNLPVLNMIGGAIFPLALLIGLAIAMSMILFAVGGPLLYPAIAVEDADAFDAVSRGFGYVLTRPWRWLFYNAVALVYGALTYLFVALVLFLVLYIVHYCLRLGVIRDLRLDAMFPRPRFSQLMYDVNWAPLGATGRLAGLFVWIWTTLAVGLLAAYAVSFWLSANTWIYLLLRRSADGNELDDVYTESRETAEAS